MLAQQSPIQIPRNGNELLDWCNHVVKALDSASEAARDPGFQENLMKFGWCAGYLQATQEMIAVTQVNVAIGASAGWKLADPKNKRELPLTALHFWFDVCIPDGKVPVGQLARVVVKWLHDHPERLHEQMTMLTLEAFRDGFPCKADARTKK